MNTRTIMRVKVQSNGDVVLARQRAQSIAKLAGFDTIKQTSFATAISEIARNALVFATEGVVTFAVDNQEETYFLCASIKDSGPGIKAVQDSGGRWNPALILKGQGISNAKKLVSIFSLECLGPFGTCVTLGLKFPSNYSVTTQAIASWSMQLAEQKPRNMLEEMHHRNQELVATLEEIQLRDGKLEKQVAGDALLKAELEENKKLLEARVVERTESLALSVEELRAFSYTVAHDLRAPLRGIHGLIQLLLEDHIPVKNMEAAQLSSQIQETTKRMDDLIEDLVAYVQAGRRILPISMVNAEESVQLVLSQLSDHIALENATIKVAGSFRPILANATIMEGALLNIIENALKFKKEGHDPVVTITGHDEDENLLIKIEDNGIGIAKEHQERIFGVFQRLHGNEIPGTGIGLALVRRWMTTLSGSVEVHSQLGVGSQFWIRIPTIRPA